MAATHPELLRLRELTALGQMAAAGAKFVIGSGAAGVSVLTAVKSDAP